MYLCIPYCSSNVASIITRESFHRYTCRPAENEFCKERAGVSLQPLEGQNYTAMPNWLRVWCSGCSVQVKVGGIFVNAHKNCKGIKIYKKKFRPLNILNSSLKGEILILDLSQVKQEIKSCASFQVPIFHCPFLFSFTVYIILHAEVVTEISE